MDDWMNDGCMLVDDCEMQEELLGGWMQVG